MKPTLASRNMIGVWVAKRWQTAGIFYEEAEVCGPVDRPFVVLRDRSAYWLGRDCFTSRTDAIARAEVLRAAKLVTLEKTARKIAGLRFDV